MGCARLCLLWCSLWCSLWCLAGCGTVQPPATTPEAIQALPDRVARLRALEWVVYSGAWDLDQLERSCAAFADAELVQACGRYLGRPHLFRGAALERGSAVAPGQEAADLPGCDEAESVVDCAVALAEDQAGLVCGSLPQPLARDECWFRLSDRLRADVPAARGSEALRSCLQAGALKGPCLHHHAEFLGGSCAPVDSSGEVRWRELGEQAAAMDVAVAHWDAFERQQVADVIWAGAMRCAFQRPSDFDPLLARSLPVGAQSHLRAAVAWHTVGGLREAPLDLTAWDQVLAGALATGQLPPASPGSAEIPAGPGQGWAHDTAAWSLAQERAGAEPCGSTQRYFAMGKRVASGDPAVDRLLALLEAAARVLPEPAPLLGQALDHEDPSVRCSARALLEWRSDGA